MVIQNKTVADMKAGETAFIVGFSDELIAIKLLEMGFLPGTSIRFILVPRWADPVCVSVSGYDLSLRPR